MTIPIFPGGLVNSASLIRAAAASICHDSRQLLTRDEPDYDLKMTEEFARGYMSFKYAVAHALHPHKICEIGVGSGISALAFLAARPNAAYLGIDDGSMCGTSSHKPLVERAMLVLPQQCANELHWMLNNSQHLNEVPGATYDLVHIDGSHLRAHTEHDVRLAWRAIAPGGYILVDDARDTAVAAGVFDAFDSFLPGSLDWAYFEDTTTGNLLIHQGKSRP